MANTRRKFKQGQIDHIYEHSYAKLQELVTNNRLVPKANYKITDFATKHLIPTTTEIHTADVEPLIITAKSTNEFFTEAKSETYPNHKLEYRFDLDTCENGTTPRTGMILSRHDLDRNVYVGCDYLGVVNRRYKVSSKRYLGTSNKLDDDLIAIISTLDGSDSPTNRTRHEVTFSEFITHAAGEVTLFLEYANLVLQKKIVAYGDQESGVLTANYLQNKSGTIIFNPELDAWVFMDFVNIGIEAVGEYLSPINSTTYNIGHGIIYNVDVNDYEDYPMFMDNYNEINIPTDHLQLGSVNYYPNTVFKNFAWRVKAGSYIRNTTFRQGINIADIGNYITDSLFLTSLQDLKIHKSASDLLMIPTSSGFGTIRSEFYVVEDVTVMPVLNMNTTYLASTSIILRTLSNFNSTAIISESNIYVTGINVGGSVPNNFYITAPMYRSLIGYLDSRSLNINKTFNNQTLYTRFSIDNSIGENILGGTQVDTLNIDSLQSPTGVIRTLGLDENNKVVEGFGSTDFTTNVSTEKFYKANYNPSDPSGEVLNTKFPKDIVYTDAGPMIITPAFMGNFIFTRANTVLRGVRYTYGQEEFTIENRSGTDLTIEGLYGAEANTQFATSHTIPNGEKWAFKSNDTTGDTWIQTVVNQVAFSDNIDSVSSIRSIGPDGLEIITEINNEFSGENINYKEVTTAPSVVDGFIYKLIGAKYFKSVITGPLNPKRYGAKANGVHDDTAAVQFCITYLKNNITTTPDSSVKGLGEIYLEKGRWKCSQLNITAAQSIIFRGDGVDATSIYYESNTGILFNVSGYRSFKLEDLSIYHTDYINIATNRDNWTNTCFKLIGVGGGNNFVIRGINIYGFNEQINIDGSVNQDTNYISESTFRSGNTFLYCRNKQAVVNKIQTCTFYPGFRKVFDIAGFGFTTFSVCNIVTEGITLYLAKAIDADTSDIDSFTNSKYVFDNCKWEFSPAGTARFLETEGLDIKANVEYRNCGISGGPTPDPSVIHFNLSSQIKLKFSNCFILPLVRFNIGAGEIESGVASGKRSIRFIDCDSVPNPESLTYITKPDGNYGYPPVLYKNCFGVNDISILKHSSHTVEGSHSMTFSPKESSGMIVNGAETYNYNFPLYGQITQLKQANIFISERTNSGTCTITVYSDSNRTQLIDTITIPSAAFSSPEIYHISPSFNQILTEGLFFTFNHSGSGTIYGKIYLSYLNF